MSERAELLERFRRGAELVAVAITGAAGPELDFKPAPDKWSVRQIVAHLADTEAVTVARLRSVEFAVAMPDEDALRSLLAERISAERARISAGSDRARRVDASTQIPVITVRAASSPVLWFVISWTITTVLSPTS